MGQETFEALILTARPAAGKSEVIDFLKGVEPAERARRYHIGPFEELDDFPYVWQLFEDDDILERLGRPRNFTSPDHYFLHDSTWTFLVHKLNLAFAKKLARHPRWLEHHTAIFEFARGGENGIRHALEHLSDEILSRAGLLYVAVSYEESVRKNRRRYDPAQKDSILYHSLPDDKMEFYYRTNDWAALSEGRSEGRISIRQSSIPFVVLENEPEVTDNPTNLGPALESRLNRLWSVRRG